MLVTVLSVSDFYRFLCVKLFFFFSGFFWVSTQILSLSFSGFLFFLGKYTDNVIFFSRFFLVSTQILSFSLLCIQFVQFVLFCIHCLLCAHFFSVTFVCVLNLHIFFKKKEKRREMNIVRPVLLSILSLSLFLEINISCV